MLNPESQEKASLYVLGLMSPAERDEFEGEQEINPLLRAEVRDLQLNVEALALAATPMTAPAGCFERIQERIEGGLLSRWHLSGSPWMMLGWPLAASLALGWAITSYHFTPSKSESKISQSVSRDPQRQNSGITPAPEPVFSEQQLAEAIEKQRLENARLQNTLRKEEANRISLLDRLGRQEARAGALENRIRSLIDVQPGMSRILVFNMHDPKSRLPIPNVLEDPGSLLANEAGRRLSPTNLVTDSGLVAFGNTSPTPPNQLYESDTKSDVRTPVTAGNPNPGFSNTVSAPTNQAQGGSNPLTGVVVYDQAVLNGYLVINGTPDLSEAQSLQVWMEDGSNRQSVGLLSRTTNGFLQVNFKLDNHEFIPNRFFVTIEPIGGSMQPSGPIVLDGPGN